jgi:hypothetical protein
VIEGSHTLYFRLAHLDILRLVTRTYAVWIARESVYRLRVPHHSLKKKTNDESSISALHYYAHSNSPLQQQTAIMPQSCIVCKAGASPDLQLQYCAICQSALYCSKACQMKDWKKQHKKICKLVNVGHGDMQVRTEFHTSQAIDCKKQFESEQQCLEEDDKRFFKLFEESTLEGSEAAALGMKTYAKIQTKHNQGFLLFYTLKYLVRSDSEMLSWPNSPLLVLLQFVDPNMLSGDEDVPLREDETRETPLHHLADLLDPVDYSTHVNQLILAKQLIEHGANVNAVSKPKGATPLHKACCTASVTNLDFVELLLQKGANPNAQDCLGLTPLMYATVDAPGAAKFLLSWPTTDVNITTGSGESILARVRSLIALMSYLPDEIQFQLVLRQWRDIEEMLVEKGAR